MNTLLREKTLPGERKLEIVQGDLTTEKMDAIVNAANSALQHGGGVAWAIVRRGGDIIQRESDDWVRKNGPVPHDKAAYTSAGQLPCRYVIHAVGPVWGEGDEDRKLAGAIRAALACADGLKLETIAFPAISTGIFGFPKDRAAGITFAEVGKYFAENSSASLKLVRVTLFDQPTVEAFLKVWDT
jgi:O-acetyl-ADP-ribose deacetylase (regulator of RNase III)